MILKYSKLWTSNSKRKAKMSSEPYQTMNYHLFYNDDYPAKLSQNSWCRSFSLKTKLPSYDKINKSNRQIIDGKSTYKLTLSGMSIFKLTDITTRRQKFT